MEPEETNQRMVALQGEAQQAPTSLVTCSSLAHSLAPWYGGRGGISEGRKGGWVEVKM